ncbi:MAG TPA: hypothetical protein QGH10_20145 [Armatimonadota bacterium]|nr:hypothetical protein [Armatimonadota bacterium]
MRHIAIAIAIAFVFCALSAAVADGPKIKTAEGDVSFICPQKCAIKVKVGDDKEVLLFVYAKCPKKDDLKEQIGGLSLEDDVKVSYWKSKDGKKLYLTKIETD